MSQYLVAPPSPATIAWLHQQHYMLKMVLWRAKNAHRVLRHILIGYWFPCSRADTWLSCSSNEVLGEHKQKLRVQ